jgi:hypothetical protein
MNFLRTKHFLEFLINRQTLVVPRLGLPTETVQRVQATSAAMLAVDWSRGSSPASGDRRRRRYRASPVMRLKLNEPEHRGEPIHGGAPAKWSPERTPASTYFNGGRRPDSKSTETSMVGGERISSNSGEVLRKGTAISRHLEPPRLDSVLW